MVKPSSLALTAFLAAFPTSSSALSTSASRSLLRAQHPTALLRSSTFPFALSLLHPQVSAANMSSSSTPSHDSNDNNNSSTPLALPASSEGKAQQLDLSKEGQTVKLEALGPMVVNVDGTLSRISNWDRMTEMERKNTVRVIGKRNKERLAKLKENEAADAAKGQEREEL